MWRYPLSGTRKSYVGPGFRLIISEAFGNRPRRGRVGGWLGWGGGVGWRRPWVASKRIVESPRGVGAHKGSLAPCQGRKLRREK